MSCLDCEGTSEPELGRVQVKVVGGAKTLFLSDFGLVYGGQGHAVRL